MIAIIGSGRIGSEAAFLLAQRGFDIRLIDIVEGLPQGHALDIMHSCQPGRVQGSNDFRDMKGSDIIINTAGFARDSRMKSRTELIKRNKVIVESVAGKIKALAPDSIVIQVSNQMDMMTYIMKKVTGFERERVMGMGGLLDSQRLAYYLSRELKADPSEIKPLVIGEHGESMVPVFSASLYQDKPVSEILPEEKRREIAEKTRASSMDVIRSKGATVFAPAVAIARMTEAILKDRGETIPVSAYLEGEYGIEGICIGVPAVLGKSGIEKIQELELSEEEARAFRASAEKIRKAISSLGL